MRVLLWVAIGLAVVMPWWHIDISDPDLSIPVEEPQPAAVTMPFWFISDGIQAHDPLVVATGLAWSGLAVWAAWAAGRSRLGAVAHVAAILGLVTAAFFQMALVSETREGTITQGIGLWAAGSAIIMGLIIMAREQQRPWPVVAGVLAVLAMHMAPMLQTQVTIDQDATYFSDGEGTFQTPMTFTVWMRHMPDHPWSTWHPWWDNFYLEHSENWGLYAAGVTLALTTVAAIIGITWRRDWLRRATVAGIGLTMFFHVIGAIGQLGSAEILASTFPWPHWGWAAAALAAWGLWQTETLDSPPGES